MTGRFGYKDWGGGWRRKDWFVRDNQVQRRGRPSSPSSPTPSPASSLGLKESEVLFAQSCHTLWDPMDCSLPGFSVHGIRQARILVWVAIPLSGGSSQPRGQTWVSWITGRFFIIWATREGVPLKSCPWLRPGNSHRLLLYPGWLLSPRDLFQEWGFECFEGGPDMMKFPSYIGCFRVLRKNIRKQW